jgi:molecular chaperone DnaK
LQGEREFARDNKSLAHFILDGIAPAPRGIPQIEVTFDIDANGIVNVTAQDKGTGKEQKVQIKASTKLSDEEIDRAVKEAEKFAAEDKLNKERVEAKNEAESTIYTAEKTLKDLADKVTDAEKSNVEGAISKLRSTLNSENTQDIKADTEALQQALYGISERIYKESGAQGAPEGEAYQSGPQSGTQSGPSPDGTYEADYKDAGSDE